MLSLAAPTGIFGWPAIDSNPPRFAVSQEDNTGYRHPMTTRRLDLYDNSDYHPGRGLVVRTLWYFLSVVFFESGFFPVIAIKPVLLRAFGASIGTGVVIKPRVRIKYPWRLSIGDHCWIGEEAWIDNLADVSVGPHSVISQGAYLCTGSHNHRVETFDLITAPIRIGAGAWICARAILLAGATIDDGVVVSAGSVVK